MREVFISYSSNDVDEVLKFCKKLEEEKIIYWIAPRDVDSGNYAMSLINGIKECPVFLLFFSSSANNSEHVLREVNQALSNDSEIIPIRLDDSMPTDSMSYYLNVIHWFSLTDKEKIIEIIKKKRDNNSNDSNDFIETIFKNLSKQNAIPQMVVTSENTNRLWYINEIKRQAKKSYREVYHIALPTEDITEKEYFKEIADEFRLRENRAFHIRRELIKLIDGSQDEVFILVTDFENDKHLDDFAKLMRAVLDKVSYNLRLITIGGEKLANLKTNMGIHSYFNYFEKHTV